MQLKKKKELYEASGNASAAVRALEQAAELFEADGAMSAATQCRLSVANLLALSGEVYKARLVYVCVYV